MSILRIDSSPLGDHSASRPLADLIQAGWLEVKPSASVVARDLAAHPIDPASWIAAATGTQTPIEYQTEEQKAGIATAHELYNELLEADAIIVATGLYNWGVNQLLKTWVDIVLSAAPLGAEILKGKDVALVVTRGGYYGDDGPKAGWDHATPWLQRVFADVWGANVTLVERDFSLVGVNPALDDFQDQAAVLKAAAMQKAEDTGRAFAARATA